MSQIKKPTIVQCKSCNADIIWITYKGKPHPLNAKPKKIFFNMNKGWETACWVFDEGYESHFATCPQAKDWRKNARNPKGGTANLKLGGK